MKFLADENLQGSIVRALWRHVPHIDLVRVQDIGLVGHADLDILRWASANQRIILTHDLRTMPDFAYQRLSTGQDFAGMITMRSNIDVQ